MTVKERNDRVLAAINTAHTTGVRVGYCTIGDILRTMVHGHWMSIEDDAQWARDNSPAAAVPRPYLTDIRASQKALEADGLVVRGLNFFSPKRLLPPRWTQVWAPAALAAEFALALVPRATRRVIVNYRLIGRLQLMVLETASDDDIKLMLFDQPINKLVNGLKKGVARIEMLEIEGATATATMPTR